jgi:hypothetical protein
MSTQLESVAKKLAEAEQDDLILDDALDDVPGIDPDDGEEDSGIELVKKLIGEQLDEKLTAFSVQLIDQLLKKDENFKSEIQKEVTEIKNLNKKLVHEKALKRFSRESKDRKKKDPVDAPKAKKESPRNNFEKALRDDKSSDSSSQDDTASEKSSDDSVFTPLFIKEKPKSDAPRRRSMLIKNLMESTKKAARHNSRQSHVNVFQQAPDLTKMKIVKITPKSVAYLLTKLTELKTRYPSYTIRPIELLSQELIQDLSSRAEAEELVDDKDLLYGGIQLLSDRKLLELICKIVTPKDRADFVRLMEENLDFPKPPENYKLDWNHFEPTFNLLRVYRTRFVALYDMVSHGVSSKVIPDLYKSKQNQKGLVNIFLEKIPDGLGQRLYEKLDSEKLKGCKDVIQFISVFYTYLQYLKEKSEENWNLFKTVTPIVKKPILEVPNRTQVNFLADTTANAKMESQDLAEIYSDEDDDNFTADAWTKPPVSGNPESTVENMEFEDLLAIQATDTKTPGGCFSQIFNSRCSTPGKCKYRHDEETCKLTWQHFFNKLKDSPYNANKYRDPKYTAVLAMPKQNPGNSDSEHAADPKKRDVNREKGRTFVTSVAAMKPPAPESQRKMPDDDPGDEDT